MKPITKEWLRFAKDDLDVVRNIIKVPHLTNMVAFHSHQVMEKCLKAIIEEFKLKMQRIHNLETLYSSVKSILNFEVDDEGLRELNEVYISARIPVIWDYCLMVNQRKKMQRSFLILRKKYMMMSMRF